jgi:hypothetical protein
MSHGRGVADECKGAGKSKRQQAKAKQRLPGPAQTSRETRLYRSHGKFEGQGCGLGVADDCKGAGIRAEMRANPASTQAKASDDSKGCRVPRMKRATPASTEATENSKASVLRSWCAALSFSAGVEVEWRVCLGGI